MRPPSLGSPRGSGALPAGPVLAGAGLAVAGVYAAQGLQFRREARRSIQLEDPPAPGSAEFARLVESWCAAPLRRGNRVEVLCNGDRIFPSLLDAIAGARRTILLSTYIFWKGRIPAQFTEALTDRARAGVDVKVLVDGWGSAPMDRAAVTRLERAGVHWVWFRYPHWYTVDKLNNRSHRRTLVVDGTVGFTGGLGIADEWGGDADGPAHWRETHLKVEGPAVADLTGAFADNWTEETGQVLTGPHLPEQPVFDGGVAVQVSKSSARQGREAAEALVAATVFGARRRLWFTTAYFAPRRSLVEALVATAGRGVDVRIVVNGPHIDKSVARRVGQRSYDVLLEAGVRVFEYQPTMIHAKVMIADEGWANVGTANLDNRSLALQEELNCSVYDPGTVATLEKHFLRDLDVSEEITAGAWRRRPLRARAVELAGEALRHSL